MDIEKIWTYDNQEMCAEKKDRSGQKIIKHVLRSDVECMCGKLNIKKDKE